MLEFKTTARDTKNAFSGLISRFHTSEESASLKTSQQKLSKLKFEEKK